MENSFTLSSYKFRHEFPSAFSLFVFMLTSQRAIKAIKRKAHSKASDHVEKVLISMELGINLLRGNICLYFLAGIMI